MPFAIYADYLEACPRRLLLHNSGISPRNLTNLQMFVTFQPFVPPQNKENKVFQIQFDLQLFKAQY